MEQLFEFSAHSWSNLWRNSLRFVTLPLFSGSEPFCQICSCGFLPTFIEWLPGTYAFPSHTFSSFVSQFFPHILCPETHPSQSFWAYVSLTLCFLPVWIPVGLFLPLCIPCMPSCPTEFHCDLAMYLLCQPSDLCWRWEGIQMMPLIETTVFKPTI